MKKLKIIPSTGNVFKDLGFKDAKKRLAKAKILSYKEDKIILPKKIKIGSLIFKIKEANIHPKKGQWDEKTKTITIHKDLPDAGKLIILIHELLHMTESTLIHNKQIKKRINHDFIEAAAFGIGYSLASCNLFKSTKLSSKNLDKLLD